MKKIFVFLVVFCIFVGGGNFSTHALAESKPATDLDDKSKQQPLPLLNERVVNVLVKNNIDFQIEDGYIIKLTQPSPELIARVNTLLEESAVSGPQQKSINSTAAKKYPTAWVYMKQYDRTKDKKFTKASKTAFATVITSWLTGFTGGAATLGKLAGAAVATYYFVESDVENVYTFLKYSYRELGPGKVGPTGSYMGNYEIKKVERVTKSSKGSGGQVKTRYKKSTIVEPFF
jgi:hypothetical protein